MTHVCATCMHARLGTALWGDGWGFAWGFAWMEMQIVIVV